MRPAKVAPEAVRDALLATFRTSGYAGASLKGLAAASGLNTASLYHRFPQGKADMALAALTRASEAFAPLVIEPLRIAAAPPARLAASAEGVRRFYGDGALACLLGVLTLSDAPAAVRDAVRGVFATWAEALTDVLAEAGSSAPACEAQDRIAGVQGGLILAQATLDASAFGRAVDRLGAWA
jgi:TetR/AcrR family transcriptional regulator, lmrAB and yxaGH operons repressor